MNKYCPNDCEHMIKEPLKCVKHNVILPVNMKLQVYRCEDCLKEEEKNEGKN